MSEARVFTPTTHGDDLSKIWSFFIVLIFCLNLTGCASAEGPRVKPAKYDEIKKDKQTGKQIGLPYLDPDLILGPNDVIGLTYFTGPNTIKFYLLQVGDTILLEFHQQKHLNRNLIIPPDGMVSPPYLPQVKATGKSVGHLSSYLTDLCKKSAIFNDVQVTASIITFNKLRSGIT